VRFEIKKIFHCSQNGVSHFMLKGKADDGVKQVRAGHNLFDRLSDIPAERETEFRLFEQIFRHHRRPALPAVRPAFRITLRSLAKSDAD
jgi:hypothetical protein